MSIVPISVEGIAACEADGKALGEALKPYGLADYLRGE